MANFIHHIMFLPRPHTARVGGGTGWSFAGKAKEYNSAHIAAAACAAGGTGRGATLTIATTRCGLLA